MADFAPARVGRDPLLEEKITMKLRSVVLSGVIFLLASLTWADTLELKNGSVIKGVYLGGSQSEIHFRVGSSTQHYAVADVVTLSFEDAATSSPEPAANQPDVPEPAPSRPSSEGFATRPMQADGSPARLYQRDTAPVTVPSGARIAVRTIDSIDSEKNKVGDKFQATLEQPLYVNDVIVAPKGTAIYGRLETVKSAGQFAGRSELRLALTGLVLDGRTYALATGDYELAGKSRSANTAKKVGGAAAVGAVIGAIVGGGKGAAVGAGVGAGAGTAVQVVTKGQQVRVPSETLLEFVLEQPVTIQVAQAR